MFNGILNDGGCVTGKDEWTTHIFYTLSVGGNCLLVITTNQCLQSLQLTNTDQRLFFWLIQARLVYMLLFGLY